MKKLFIICGPTATGKTELALKLAQKFNGELISADSRQVYQGMDIGTGKDIPAVFSIKYLVLSIRKKKVRILYYSNGTKIWGYDLVKPTEDFSVAHFTQITWKIINHLWAKNKLPIIVGGTGLYLKTLLEPPISLNIPPNSKLRSQLENSDINTLQKQLKQINPKRFQLMNHSDQHNPRRLIRAIEISLSTQNHPTSSHFDTTKYRSNTNILWIGLSAPLVELDSRIDKRVLARSRHGMTQEVKQLIHLYSNWKQPAFSATGYREWRAYLEGKLSKEAAIAKWQQLERQYARRQNTWFKKMPGITWFDISRPGYQDQVVQTVKNWYANTK